MAAVNPLFATETQALRGSGLKYLLECPMRFSLTLGSVEANIAMQTGSAVHELIERFEEAKRTPLTDDVIKKTFDKYTLAKQEEAITYFRGYERQEPKLTEKYGEIVAAEKQTKCLIAPYTTEEKEIVVYCTIDQLRKKKSQYAVIDFKVSSQPIADSMLVYALQMSAYIQSIAQTYKTKNVVAVIANPVLMSRPRSVWMYECKIDVAKASKLLEPIAHVVSAIRQGVELRKSGTQCARCPKKSPENC